MAAAFPLVILVLLVDLSLGGSWRRRGLELRCPSTMFEVWLPRIVLWFPLFVMVVVVWPRGGAGLSRRNVALRHGLRLSPPRRD